MSCLWYAAAPVVHARACSALMQSTVPAKQIVMKLLMHLARVRWCRDKMYQSIYFCHVRPQHAVAHQPACRSTRLNLSETHSWRRNSAQLVKSLRISTSVWHIGSRFGFLREVRISSRRLQFCSGPGGFYGRLMAAHAAQSETPRHSESA